MNLPVVKIQLKAMAKIGRTEFYHGGTSRPLLSGALSLRRSWLLDSTVDTLSREYSMRRFVYTSQQSSIHSCMSPKNAG